MNESCAGTLLARPAQSPLSGTIRPPGDKSISHRALILSLLAHGESEIEGLLESEDVKATARACEQLGGSLCMSAGSVRAQGPVALKPPTHTLDMGNSGTAMRLLAGVLCSQEFDSTLAGDESLSRRPMNRIIKPLRLMGASLEASKDGTPPLHIFGGRKIRGIAYESPVASAQVKSCVLLAGLGASGETSVSEPYSSRDHTERMLQAFGAGNSGLAKIRGGARLHGTHISVPGDISSAAFFMVAASLIPESGIHLKNVGLNPTRDGIVEVLRRMGADIEIVNARENGHEPVADVHVRYKQRLRAVNVEGDMIPRLIDELPIIMVAACSAKGTTRIRDARELRVKESDRISVMARGLRQAGIRLAERDDGIDVEGGCGFKSRGEIIEMDACGDHRCAMSFAVLAMVLDDPVRIRGAENIATSYPGFVSDFTQAGASISEEGQENGG